MIKSERIKVTEPTFYTLRFYPDMIRVKRLRNDDEVVAEGDNWVKLQPGTYGFFGTSLEDVRCTRLDKPQEDKPTEFSQPE